MPPLTPEMEQNKKKTMKMCLSRTPRSAKKGELLQRGLLEGISQDGLQDLIKYLDNQTSSKSGNFGKEVASTFCRYLYFAGCRAAPDYQTLCNHQKIQAWLEALAEAGMSSSTLYNKVLYLKKCRRYAIMQEYMEEPTQAFNVWEEDTLRR